MATLPNASVTLATSGGGAAKGSALLCIMSPVEQGPMEPRLYQRVQDHLDVHGRSAGLDLAAHYVQLTSLPYLLVPLAQGTAASRGPADTSGITGTSAVSFSGTPLDTERLAVKVIEGGTVGTAGITIRTSRDKGRTWGRIIRLGTSTSYAIPDTGVTVSFGTGTLVADDIAYQACSGPMWDAAALATAFDQLAASVHLPRLVVVCGDVDDSTDLQDVIDEIEAYETEHNRHARVLCNARSRFPDAVMQISRGRLGLDGVFPTDVDFDAGADTITRNTGSWVDDGFLVGQSVTIAGSASNNGVKGVLSAVTATVLTLPASPGLSAEANVNGASLTITGVGPGDLDFVASGFTITRNIGSWVTDGFKVGMDITVDGTSSNDNGGEVLGTVTNVTATVLTLDGGVADESNVSALGVTITGVESKATWRAEVEEIIGNTPQTAKESHRVMLGAGQARRKSPLDGSRKWRPAVWPIAIRCMDHQLHVSPAKVALGGLEGWEIHDEDGMLVEHDERVDGGLLAMRAACLTTVDDFPGVYCALPLTLAEDDTPLSRLPVGLVADLVCRIARREFTRRLNEDVITKTSGIMTEAEYQRIEGYVLGRLRAALVSPTSEGQLASSIDAVTMDRTVNILDPGAEVPVEVEFTPRGYLESIAVTVRVNAGEN